jgi:hypothetical protein
VSAAIAHDVQESGMTSSSIESIYRFGANWRPNVRLRWPGCGRLYQANKRPEEVATISRRGPTLPSVKISPSWGYEWNGEYKIDIHHPLTLVCANSCFARALVAVGWAGGGVVLVGNTRLSGWSLRDELIGRNQFHWYWHRRVRRSVYRCQVLK